MSSKFTATSLTLLVLLITSAVPGQTQTPGRSPSTGQPAAPASSKLAGNDQKRARQLNQAASKAGRADRWDDVISAFEELVALRTRVQGAKHYESVEAACRLKAARRVAALPKDDRAEFLAMMGTNARAIALERQAKYTEAQSLFEKVLAAWRRLLGEDDLDTARGYNNLGANFKAQKKYAQAQPLFEKALAIRQRLLSDDHPDTARSYDELAANFKAQSKAFEAQPLCEKALAIRQRILSDDHPDTARSYEIVAMNLVSQRKRKEAQPLFEKALGIHRRLYGDEHLDTVLSYDNVAMNLIAQEKNAEALPLCEKALPIHRRLQGENHPETARAYNNLALSLDAQGKYAAAQPFLEKSLQIRRKLYGENSRETAVAYNNLATNFDGQGKHGEAQALIERTLAIRRQLSGDNSAEMAECYNNLAANLKAQGKIAEAQLLYERAMAIYRRVYPADHPLALMCYQNLALSLDAQGQHTTAEAMHRRVLEIRRRLLTDNHHDTVHGYSTRAKNLDAQRKSAEAQALFEKALGINRQLLGDDHLYTAYIDKDLATCLLHQGKYGEARSYLEKALGIFRRVLTDNHLATAGITSRLAESLNAERKYAEARDHWLRAARGFEAARLLAASTGLDRATATTRDDPMIALAAVLARLGQPDEAWQRLEEDLGRGLLDELAAREDRRLSPEDRAELQQRIAEVERLDRLFEAPITRSDLSELRKHAEDFLRQRERAQFALGKVRARIAATYGTPSGQVATRAEIQFVLPPDAALVSWIDRPPAGPKAADPSGEHWGVVVRARGTPAWVRLAGSGPDRRWTAQDARLATLIRNALSEPPRPGVDVQPWLERLRAQRLAPLVPALQATADGLPAARRLIVLPSAAMTGVPVEALLRPDDPWTVTYAPSATVLTHLRKQPRSDTRGGLLALGDPIFDRRDPRLASGVATSGAENYGRLPGTRYEVEALAHLFQEAGRPARLLTDGEASEPELDRLATSGALGQFAFIHLATHGLVDEAFPQSSAVILTLTGLPDPLTQVLNHQAAYDGRLAMREIQRSWDLKAELVTLSACETARGQFAGGEGFLGFTQALLMSGARSLCLSLWKVDDTATALLMQRFYANLLGVRPGLARPLPKAEALAEAKGWLRGLRRDDVVRQVASLSAGEVRSKGAVKRKAAAPALRVPPGPNDDRPFAHPYFWAAFVLVGDPD
jgi:CHAT domain-containing protein/tetratricopeptide (TPR) repeat protein